MQFMSDSSIHDEINSCRKAIHFVAVDASSTDITCKIKMHFVGASIARPPFHRKLNKKSVRITSGPIFLTTYYLLLTTEKELTSSSFFIIQPYLLFFRESPNRQSRKTSLHFRREEELYFQVRFHRSFR